MNGTWWGDWLGVSRLAEGAIFLLVFLLGSVPFGILVARLFNVQDLTSRGSGNIGATNVSRVIGFWPAGFLTFMLDALKGALPALIFTSPALRGGMESWFTSLLGDGSVGVALTAELGWIAALVAVCGHCFSPWVHFRGGKGVATGFGALLILSPGAALCGIAGFALSFLEKRIGSLSSLVGLMVAALAHLVLNPISAHLWAGATMILIILFRHESNIDALLEDREKSFG